MYAGVQVDVAVPLGGYGHCPYECFTHTLVFLSGKEEMEFHLQSEPPSEGEGRREKVHGCGPAQRRKNERGMQKAVTFPVLSSRGHHSGSSRDMEVTVLICSCH